MKLACLDKISHWSGVNVRCTCHGVTELCAWRFDWLFCSQRVDTIGHCDDV